MPEIRTPMNDTNQQIRHPRSRLQTLRGDLESATKHDDAGNPSENGGVAGTQLAAKEHAPPADGVPKCREKHDHWPVRGVAFISASGFAYLKISGCASAS